MSNSKHPPIYVRSITTGSGASLDDHATQVRLAALLLNLPQKTEQKAKPGRAA